MRLLQLGAVCTQGRHKQRLENVYLPVMTLRAQPACASHQEPLSKRPPCHACGPVGLSLPGLPLPASASLASIFSPVCIAG